MSILSGGMYSICCHMARVLAFMHLYSIFNLRLKLFFCFLLKSGSETPDRNGQWYQHLLTLFAIFSRAIPKELTFGLCLCFTFVYDVPVLRLYMAAPTGVRHYGVSARTGRPGVSIL